MAVIEKKAPMVLGIGAALAGVFLLLRKKKPPLPEPPPNGVVVGLLNPPKEATMWSISLTDWDVTTVIDFVGHNGIDRLDIAEVATFEIPEGLEFPLRIVDLSLKKWKDDIVGGTIQYLYAVQSYRPFLWDWDKMDWGDEPDPSYKEIFIPDYGSYYYNVAKERFEQ